MVLWIGVDDTDSLQGMCTTFLATELVRELTREYDLIGYPRLVRLNPNIPWKTRGNGAVCLRIGEGRGPSCVVGWIGDREIRAFPRSRSDPRPAEVRDRVAKVVETWSRFEEDTTNPAFAILERPPSSGLWPHRTRKGPARAWQQSRSRMWLPRPTALQGCTATENTSTHRTWQRGRRMRRSR